MSSASALSRQYQLYMNQSTLRISSSFTLFFRMFFPIFWAVFFGAFTIGFLVVPNLPSVMDNNYFRIGLVIFYLSGLALLYFTILRLKRVELDSDFVYVTNFLKTYRYPFHNIESIHEVNLYFFQLATMRFKEKGSFGKKIYFLESRIKFQNALAEFIDLKIIYENSKTKQER